LLNEIHHHDTRPSIGVVSLPTFAEKLWSTASRPADRSSGGGGVHLYSEQFIADMSIGCCHQIARQGMLIPGGAPGEG